MFDIVGKRSGSLTVNLAPLLEAEPYRLSTCTTYWPALDALTFVNSRVAPVAPAAISLGKSGTDESSHPKRMDTPSSNAVLMLLSSRRCTDIARPINGADHTPLAHKGIETAQTTDFIGGFLVF